MSSGLQRAGEQHVQGPRQQPMPRPKPSSRASRRSRRSSALLPSRQARRTLHSASLRALPAARRTRVGGVADAIEPAAHRQVALLACGGGRSARRVRGVSTRCEVGSGRQVEPGSAAPPAVGQRSTGRGRKPLQQLGRLCVSSLGGRTRLGVAQAQALHAAVVAVGVVDLGRGQRTQEGRAWAPAVGRRHRARHAAAAAAPPGRQPLTQHTPPSAAPAPTAAPCTRPPRCSCAP